MAGLSIKALGIAQTRAMIQRLAEKEEEASMNLVKYAAAKIQREAMRTVPVDTGNLKRSIMLSVDDDGKAATVTATADYAAYVEYGTRYMSARPYMRPAASSVAAELGIDCESTAREVAQGVK